MSWRRSGIVLMVAALVAIVGWLVAGERLYGLAAVALVGGVALWIVTRWRRRRRPARRRAAPRDHIPRAVRQAIYRRDGYACRYCGRRRSHTVRLELDHFFPVARGGTDDPANLVTACFDCNRAKGARLLLDEQALRRFVSEREAVVATMRRGAWHQALRRDLVLTAIVALIVILTYLALNRWLW
jgi:5-methylcytosine-specific restriction endonuclease McrA